MLIPVFLLFSIPIVQYITYNLWSLTLQKNSGNININFSKKDDYSISTTPSTFIDLSNDKRIFYSKIINRDNLTTGFSKLYYTVTYYNIDNENKKTLILQDTELYKNFLIPKEEYYLTHVGPNNANSMEIKFDYDKSNRVNILPDKLPELERKVLEVSNLSINLTGANNFSIDFKVNNKTTRPLKNLVYQYIITNTKNEIKYIGNNIFSEVVVGDNEFKTISNLSYPKDLQNKDLKYINDYNTIVRYNFFEYE